MRDIMDPCLFGRNILMGWDLTTWTSVYRNLDITEDGRSMTAESSHV